MNYTCYEILIVKRNEDQLIKAINKYIGSLNRHPKYTVEDIRRYWASRDETLPYIGESWLKIGILDDEYQLNKYRELAGVLCNITKNSFAEIRTYSISNSVQFELFQHKAKAEELLGVA